MKHRITYLVHDGESIPDPENIKVTKDSVAVPPVGAAEEWRVTMGLEDLPQEVRRSSDSIRHRY